MSPRWPVLIAFSPSLPERHWHCTRLKIHENNCYCCSSMLQEILWKIIFKCNKVLLRPCHDRSIFWSLFGIFLYNFTDCVTSKYCFQSGCNHATTARCMQVAVVKNTVLQMYWRWFTYLCGIWLLEFKSTAGVQMIMGHSKKQKIYYWNICSVLSFGVMAPLVTFWGYLVSWSYHIVAKNWRI